MLRGATPAETCFAALLDTSFSEKFQRETAALVMKYKIANLSENKNIEISSFSRLCMAIISVLIHFDNCRTLQS